MAKPVGTKNKRTQDLIDLIEGRFPGYNPILAMIEIALDPRTETDLAFRCHSEVAPYLYPKRKAVELAAENGTFALHIFP